MLRKVIAHIYTRGKCCSISLKTGVATAKTAVGSAQNKEQRNTGWCRQRFGGHEGGTQGVGDMFFLGWDFKTKIFGKIKHIYPYVWSLVNYLFSQRICKDLVDFISHRGLFKHLLCIRSPGLQLVSGKECPPGLEREPGACSRSPWDTAEVSGPRCLGPRLKCFYPAFAIQSHSSLYGTIH